MKSIDIYEKFSKYPFGNLLFSKLVCFKAPYFGSIRPLITHINGGCCKINLKKRRAVTNHLGTVHAIAMCNLAELSAGLAIDSCLQSHLRWIPKGMSVEYLKKATTNLSCIASIDPKEIVEGDNSIVVKVKDEKQELVFTAKISIYV